MISAKLTSALCEHGNVWCMDKSSLRRFLEDDGERRLMARVPSVKGTVAVIPLHGVVTKRGSWFSDGTDRVLATVKAAMDNRQVGGIVLDIDSPGGSSYGLQEFADELYSMRGKKPLWAIANPLSASAAYWAGTAVDKLAIVPSGDVGSVGVWSMHVDYSKALDNEGVKPTFVYAGKYKVEGNPYEPLTEEAREEMQRSVDETYSQFVETLARNRNTSTAKVLANFGEGRLLSAKRAVESGMVDRIDTLDKLISRMLKDSSPVKSRAQEAEIHECLMAAWDSEIDAEVERESEESVKPTGTSAEVARRRRERQRRQQVLGELTSQAQQLGMGY